MKIEIYGSGCAKCNAVENMIRHAVEEMKIDAEVIKVTDLQKMIEKGIMFTPVVFVDGVKKSEGKVPSINDVKKWLEEKNNE